MTDQKPIRVLVIGVTNQKITFLSRLFQGLADHDIKVILAQPKQWMRKVMESKQYQYLRTPSMKNPWFIKPLILIYLLVSSLGSKHIHWLITLVRKEQKLKDKFRLFYRYAPFCNGKFDIIYFPWNSTAITYRGLFEIGKPVVISCRGSQINIRPHLPKQQAFVSGLQNTFIRATAVHCISKNIQIVAEHIGLDSKKAFIINPAVDTDFFSPVKEKKDNKNLRIIMIGSLRWSKGYEYGLIAFSKFLRTHKNSELHIIGDGYAKQNILFTIYDMGIEDNVILYGKLSPIEVRDKLREADIFLHSSLSEGFTNSAIEAQACGLPVVCFNVGGLPENIKDKISGFLIPLRNTNKMANALEKLAVDSDLRRKMGVAARKRVVNNFGINNQLEEFKSVFIHLASKHNE